MVERSKGGCVTKKGGLGGLLQLWHDQRGDGETAGERCSPLRMRVRGGMVQMKGLCAAMQWASSFARNW